MTNLEIVSFTISVSLGVVSIVLAGFAIWLSRTFDQRSSAALDSVKELAVEIRSLVDIGLSQQKEFSSKMLDSIISRDQYGNPNDTEQQGSSPVEQVIRNRLGDMEERIVNAIEENIRISSANEPKDQAALQHTLEAIRSEIRDLTNNAASSVTSYIDLPLPLRRSLVRRKDFPVHYVLLAAIIKEDTKSIDELRAVRDKYDLPEPLESGLENLLEDLILQGSEEDFHVAAEFRTPLTLWIDKNWRYIEKLVNIESKHNMQDEDLSHMSALNKQRAIAEMFDF